MKKNLPSEPRGGDRINAITKKLLMKTNLSFDLNGTPTSQDSNLTSPIGNVALLRGLAFRGHSSARPVLAS